MSAECCLRVNAPYGVQLFDGIQKPWVALAARLVALRHESVPSSS